MSTTNNNLESIQVLFEQGVLTKEEYELKKKMILSAEKAEKENLAAIESLEELLREGVLTEEEFNLKKKQILSANASGDVSKGESLDNSGIIKPVNSHKADDVKATDASTLNKDKPVDEKYINNERDSSEKNRKKIIFAIAACSVVLVIVAVLFFSGRAGSWAFDKDKAQAIEYEAVTVYVPDNWKVIDIDNGKAAELSNKAWLDVEYRGTFKSMKQLLADLKSDNMPTEGEDVKIAGTDEARKINEYINDSGETVMAYAVLVNGKGYWIGGGAKEKNLSNYSEMLDAAEYHGAKSTSHISENDMDAILYDDEYGKVKFNSVVLSDDYISVFFQFTNRTDNDLELFFKSKDTYVNGERVDAYYHCQAFANSTDPTSEVYIQREDLPSNIGTIKEIKSMMGIAKVGEEESLVEFPITIDMNTTD